MKDKKRRDEPTIKVLLEYANSIIATLREPFLVLDKNLRVISANHAFYTTFEVTEKKTIGRPLPDLGDRQWNIPKLLQLLKEIIPEKKVVKDYEIEHKFEQIGERVMRLNARHLRVPKKIAGIIATGIREKEREKEEEEKDGQEELILLAIEDITERKEIEDGLEKTRKELAVIKKTADEVSEFAENIINTVREPLIALDQNLRVVKVSDSFYEFFKVNPEDTMGQLIYDLGNKQWDIPKLRELLEDILPQKATFDNYEVEHDFVGIGRRIMLLNARQIEQAMGKKRIILLAIEDITERKRLQETLKESEERYRRAFETSQSALLLVHKTEANILKSNVCVEELLGYSPEDFLEKKLWEIGVVKNDLEFQGLVSRLEADGVVYYEDTPLKTKEGPSINSEVFLTDRAKVIQCNIRDITERKEAEEVLKESETRFKTIFNESADGMLLAEVETRRFSMCNPKICQMLGYTEEELMRLGVDDIHPKNDLPLVIEQFERQAKGEIKVVADLPVKRKDGSIFYADVSISQITLGGGKYLLGSFKDITESKKIQDELKEKMQDLERFSKFAVDRELKMEELEKKIKELEERLQSR